MHFIRSAAPLAVLALIPVAAQAQATLTACYIPKTGTVYRIQVAGAPTKCGPNHVEFSWQTTAEPVIPTFLPDAFAEAFVVPAGETADVKLSCPSTAGALVTGGYVKLGPDPELVEVLANAPDGAVNTWWVRVANNGSGSTQVGLFIRCEKLG